MNETEAAEAINGLVKKGLAVLGPDGRYRTTQPPNLHTYWTGPGTVRAWCPGCSSYHHHSYTEEESGWSHRAAHCHGNSPLTDTGYFINPNMLGTTPVTD